MLLEANWIRKAEPKTATMVSGLAWERVTAGSGDFPASLFSDDNFAMFSAKRDGAVVAGGTFYRADGVVGLSNVVAEFDDEPAVWRDLASLAAATFPGLPLVGYELGDELDAAKKAGFEVGDPLRIWVVARE